MILNNHNSRQLNPQTSRRNFLGITAGAVVATAISAAPAEALAAIDPTKISAGMRAAVNVIEAARETLEAAKAEVDRADRLVVEWQHQHGPCPTSKRGAKRWHRKANDYRFEVMTPPWDRQMEAEQAFGRAQMALARINPTSESELLAKAYCAVVYDAVRMAGGQSAVIGFSVALATATRHATGNFPGAVQL